MDNKYAENWQEYNKSALEAAKELEIINTDVIEKLTSKQSELVNAAVETGTKSVQAMAEFKGPQDLVAEQTKLSRAFNDQVMQSARATADIISASREAYGAWLENRLTAITAHAETVATPKKSTQKAA